MQEILLNQSFFSALLDAFVECFLFDHLQRPTFFRKSKGREIDHSTSLILETGHDKAAWCQKTMAQEVNAGKF